MKPLRLDIEAFGPFGDHVHLDFEQLGDIGLFVVSGPTGAGKTSLFDAMCFALFGVLPGNRSLHSAVRSDHADPRAESSVTLEFGAGQQEWKVWRRPKQLRAKKYGSGTTEIGADASLHRREDGAWVPVSSGVNSVTAQCRSLIGLTAEQFQRVVLLPQGRFQDVLNASSIERAGLLRTLFGSELYDRAAHRLRDQAGALRDTLGDAEQQRTAIVGRAAARVAEARALLVDDTESADERPTPTDEAVRIEIAALRTGPLHSATARADAAVARASAANAAVQTASAQAKALETRAALLIEQLELTAARPAQLADLQLVAAARAAAPVVRAADRARISTEDVERARRGADRAWSAAHASLAPLAPHGFSLPAAPGLVAADEVIESLDRQLAILEGLAADLATARKEEKTAEERCAHAVEGEHELTGTAARLVELDAKRTELTDRHAAATLLVGQLPVLRKLSADADRRVEAHAALVDADRAVAVVEKALAGLRERRSVLTVVAATRAGDRKALQALLDQLVERTAARDAARARLTDRRTLDELVTALPALTASAADHRTLAAAAFDSFLAGTAPRLAAELQAGHPCMVCGSPDHPAAAQPTEAAAVASIEDVEAANAAAVETDQRLRAQQERIATILEAHPGLDRENLLLLKAAYDTADASLAEAVAAGPELARLEELIEKAAAEQAALDSELERQQAALASAQAASARIRGSLGDGGTIDHESLAHAAATAARAVADAEAAARAIVRIEGDLELQDRLAAKHAARIDSLRGAIAAAKAEATTHLLRAKELRDQVDAEIGDADPAELIRSARTARTQVAEARGAAQVADEREHTLAAASAELATALAASPFDELADAVDAALSEPRLAALVARTEAWTTRTTAVEAQLETLAAQELPDHAPRLDELVADADARSAEASALVERARTAGQHLSSAEADLAETDQIASDHQDARRRLELVATAANVVSGDNQRRSSLESWVLAAYLREVVDHANVHLDTMSRGRYRLEVEIEPADKRRQAGLGLVIDDAYGQKRSTVSLSGGETFMASLSLALGLADVVMAGRAGLRLDALFVDEGFGSLDPNAVDQAIEVLDGLRSRGSVVGVITHVEAMKTALPVAIEVLPRADRRGSTVRQLI